MKIRAGSLAGALVLLLVSGCGGEGGGEAGRARTPAEEAAELDKGPRAVEVLTLDPDRAEPGAALFEDRLCADCHTLGEADMAPDLVGVLDRRTLPWLEKMITDPAWMNEHDPIAKALIEEYDLEMAGPAVSEAEALDILHFLLRESGAAAE